MKFGQLIEYNMRNIFREKLYTKCGREAQTLLQKIKINSSQHLHVQSQQ